MYMVQTAWPQADLVGVDMSTYKLAISQAKLEKKSEAMKSKVSFFIYLFIFVCPFCLLYKLNYGTHVGEDEIKNV